MPERLGDPHAFGPLAALLQDMRVLELPQSFSSGLRYMQWRQTGCAVLRGTMLSSGAVAELQSMQDFQAMLCAPHPSGSEVAAWLHDPSCVGDMLNGRWQTWESSDTHRHASWFAQLEDVGGRPLGTLIEDKARLLNYQLVQGGPRRLLLHLGDINRSGLARARRALRQWLQACGLGQVKMEDRLACAPQFVRRDKL